MTMVNDRSESSRFRTGIHGGLRRGSAAAAIGAVLVLSAGVPASQADAVPDSGDADVQVTGAVPLPEIGGLLQGLLGTAPASPQPTPVPEATSASPSPAPTTAPTTVSPSPATSSTSGATYSPQEAAAAPGAASAPSQQPGTAGSQLLSPPAGQGSAPQTAEAPATEQSAAGQPDAGAASPAAARPTASAASPAGSRASGSGTLQAAGAPARGRHEMGPARDAEPAGAAAKVWLGVGLVGSAGAAGLVFTRIRRI
jgi:hypothetical protein